MKAAQNDRSAGRRRTGEDAQRWRRSPVPFTDPSFLFTTPFFPLQQQQQQPSGPLS
jgi:hypothetical protein